MTNGLSTPGTGNPLRAGSLCTGYGGIEIALEKVFPNINLCWVAENDEACVRILKHRFPEVENLGNIREICYDKVEPIDLLAAGFPCQDVSLAGGRKGLREGNRSGLWFEVARAIDELQPRFVFLENVHGLLSAKADSKVEPCQGCVGNRAGEPLLRALGCVLGDLASLGYDAQWHCVRASNAGAPHRRARVFILGYPNEQGLQGGAGEERADGVPPP